MLIEPRPGAGVEEHNNKFHHWHQGQDGGVAIQLEEPKLFWCLVRSSMSDLAMRQVLDGGDIVAQFTPSLLDTKVSPPPPPRCWGLHESWTVRGSSVMSSPASAPNWSAINKEPVFCASRLLYLRLRLWWTPSWVACSGASTHRCLLAGLVPLGPGDVWGAAVQPAAGRLLGERL